MFSIVDLALLAGIRTGYRAESGRARVPPLFAMRPFATLTCAALMACAPYGFHRPAQTLKDGETVVGVSLDLASFFARVAQEEREADRLDEGLLLPAVFVRRGIGGAGELDLSVFPLGIRAGARLRLFESGSATGVAEAGLTVAAALAPESSPTDWRALLLPDAALAVGYSLAEQDQAYAALRYLWLREKIAGSGFSHTPGLTLGYAFDAGRVDLDLEATALYSPQSGDWVLVPGIGAGLRAGTRKAE